MTYYNIKQKLPFISINEPLNLEKIRSIKVLDTNEKEIYTMNYRYVENFKEEFIPMKFLITGSQKFNQLLFVSDKNKKLLQFILIIPWAIIFIVLLIVLIGILLTS